MYKGLIILSLIWTVARPPIPADHCKLYVLVGKTESFYCRVCEVPCDTCGEENNTIKIDCSMNGKGQQK